MSRRTSDDLCDVRGYGPVFETRLVDGLLRDFVLYVPPRDSVNDKVPLWVVLGGTGDTSRFFLEYTGLDSFAMQQRFAFVSPQGHGYGAKRMFNVGLNCAPNPNELDDMPFVQDLLTTLTKLPCIDLQRVHCTGYSNGGRFCVRLAAEMSEVIASIAVVAALRYPRPNAALRPIPVLAFHGSADRVNPWNGHGNPSYWRESVLDAFNDWGEFNGCNKLSELNWMTFAPNIRGIERSSGCQEKAAVELIEVVNGGHTWPGCSFDRDNSVLGKCNRDIAANQLVLNFFDAHPMSPIPRPGTTEPSTSTPTSTPTKTRLTTPTPTSTSQTVLHTTREISRSTATLPKATPTTERPRELPLPAVRGSHVADQSQTLLKSSFTLDILLALGSLLAACSCLAVCYSPWRRRVWRCVDKPFWNDSSLLNDCGSSGYGNDVSDVEDSELPREARSGAAQHASWRYVGSDSEEDGNAGQGLMRMSCKSWSLSSSSLPAHFRQLEVTIIAATLPFSMHLQNTTCVCEVTCVDNYGQARNKFSTSSTSSVDGFSLYWNQQGLVVAHPSDYISFNIFSIRASTLENLGVAAVSVFNFTSKEDFVEDVYLLTASISRPIRLKVRIRCL